MTSHSAAVKALVAVASASILLGGAATPIAAAAGYGPSAGDDAEEPAATPDPDLIFSETVVVTASRREQRIADAPAAVSIIGRDQLATSPADNYADLMRGVPGLNVIQTSARSIFARARGATTLNVDSMRVLIDGRQLGDTINWDTLPIRMNDIEAIEIVRGPSSVVWGPNAQSGVVNIRTRAPRDGVGAELKLMVGEVSTREVEVRWAHANDRLAYRISASYYEQDAWERSDTFPDGTPVPDEFKFVNEGTEQPKVDLRFDYDQSEESRWSFRGGYSDTSGINMTLIGPVSINDDGYSAYTEVDYEGPHFDVKGYWNIGRGGITALFTQEPTRLDSDTVYGEITSRRLVADRHSLVYGGNIRFVRQDGAIIGGEQWRGDGGAFAEGVIDLGRRTDLTAGCRVDYFETSGFVASPRVNLGFRIDERNGLRAAYSRAYRAPSHIESYTDTVARTAIELIPGAPPFVFPIAIQGNLDLDPEITDGFELAYTADQLLGPATLSITGYVNRNKNQIASAATDFYGAEDPPPGWPLPPALVPPGVLPKTVTNVNRGTVIDKGVEVAVDASWATGLGVTASYTYQAKPVVEDTTEDVVNRPPKHMAGLTGWYRQPRYRAQLGMTYTDEAFWADIFDARFWGTTDAYFLVNASFAWRLSPRAGEVVVAATNVFNNEVQQYLFGDIIGRKATVAYRNRF